MQKNDSDKITLASYFLSGIALVSVLSLGLLPALLGGFLVYSIIVFGAERLGRVGVLPGAAKIILLIVIALTTVALFAIGGIMFASFVSDGPESVVGLLKRMADVVATARKSMPEWTHAYLPSNLQEWQVQAHEWLLGNAQYLSEVGRDAGLFLMHLIVGMIIGGMAALHSTEKPNPAPLSRALKNRVSLLGLSFRQVVFSQIRISGLNTILTSLFLVLVMPAIGYQLPLIKTMITVTFIVGLMPIIGNIISNTVIVLIALGVAPGAAVSALIFLILIHKLEYFVNARIIGTQIRANAWEILVALLVMDAAFGIAGLVAAPIYYAYLKNELATKKLI